ncbi:hypothetical protein VPBG_00255 [Vibrio phage helene 12B3]|uniref:hypothetical protein n=1 Tax=Vibrio phage helene 12B3 TaxID=573173 RepID=UPI0002C0A70B|nr:hypothetical protein VPBG_00255 [Vibrio phage helene 12B3]YP_009222871.1 hypothetical protein VPLG_00022 [Vibrio phage eugene 12A10]AGG58027.1 hypothetical protein VPBG_00255 [Vibrio phage helene 12B3]AGN51461.1 hypothetical protein VPLG_00022 [Vibrio phage eugene 12A10]
MNEPIYDLNELSTTWQRIVSCSKGLPLKGVQKEIVDKLKLAISETLESQIYTLEDLSKAQQRIASVSGSDSEMSNLLLCKISSKL